MQRMSGFSFSSQRMTSGRRAITELTFQVAIFILEYAGKAKRRRRFSIDSSRSAHHESAWIQRRRRRFALPAHSKSQTGYQSSQQRASKRNVVGQNMFVRGMRAITLHPQTIKHRHTQRADKVSVRCASDACFTQVKVQPAGDVPGMSIQTRHLLGSLEGRPVDAARNNQFGAFVKRLRLENCPLDSLTDCLGSKTQINFGAGLSRDHVRMSSSRNHIHGHCRTAGAIVQFMKANRLLRELEHCTDTL